MFGATEPFPGIHRFVAPLGDRIVACYGLIGARRTLLLDTGIASNVGPHLLPALGAANIPVENLDWVVISHSDLDHSGGNAAVRALAPRAQFHCHVSDRRMIEEVETLITERYRCYATDHGIDESPASLTWLRENVRHTPMDVLLRGGEILVLGETLSVEVVHLPGHSRGHIGLYDRERRVLLGQDCVLGSAVPTKDNLPAFPPTYRYVDDYLATIDRVEALQLDALLTAHYPPMLSVGAVSSFLSESRQFVNAADAALLDALAAARGPLTMRELISRVSRSLGQWPDAASEFLVWPLSGHLERLESTGVVTRDARHTSVQYSLKRS